MFLLVLITTTTRTGTGLGLVISKQYCHIMGGDITAVSEYGKGSTFAVCVPFRISSPKPQRNAAVQSLMGRCVLVVDDNAVVRKIIVRALTRCGCSCLEAEDGQQALKILRENMQQQQDNIHAILLDCLMPVMDGYADNYLLATIAVRAKSQSNSHFDFFVDLPQRLLFAKICTALCQSSG